MFLIFCICCSCNSQRSIPIGSVLPPKMEQQRTKITIAASSGCLSLFFLLSMLCSPKIVCGVDTITKVDSIKDGETIISSGGTFEMGFFSPGKSKYRYVGIWYKKISLKTVVWVANRETPLTGASGVLKFIEPGVLALLNDTNSIVWSTNVSRTEQKPIAQLLDSGNLVVRDANNGSPENFLWQSFDFPTDTLLPEMKLGWNLETGKETYLSTWKSNDDPAPGEFTYHCDPVGYPQNVIKRGSHLQYRAGPWNGLRFSGALSSRESPFYKIDLVFNKKEVYFASYLLSKVATRYVLNQSGVAQRWTWVDRTQEWVLYLTLPSDNCDSYDLCGPHGICRIGNSPICDCLDRFEPKYPNNWIVADWSDGCVRRTLLECHNGDGFLKYSGVKLPDTRHSWYNGNMSLEECRLKCLKNCSCVAYANSDIRNGGSGCLLWFEELIDIREVNEGQDIYIRMASSEIASFGSKRKRRKIIILSLSMLTVIVFLGLSLAFYIKIWRWKSLKLKETVTHIVGRQIQDDQLPHLDFATIAKATNGFSLENKLGEGGFGPVYKGMLEEGKEIAVKRLSKSSVQGLDEFKNEVACIAKLQHRNLVKLLGCCIEGEEKMLIYEYMHNTSLDSFIFDPTRSKLLDWPKRFHIINGIARGLLYLHQDSQLRIIHRDLKASNVLLDIDMNPKISDFGLARSFGGNETGDKTGRVIGTYGYMSPEYAVRGIFSVKSDVFSFGVSVLEIVSGKRNKEFFHGDHDHDHNLIGHAWMLYKEGRSLELVDANLGNSFHVPEVLRSIHVGLLCVQQSPQDRPNMSSVVLMLSNDSDFPEAKHPGFFMESNGLDNKCCSSSTNDITITNLCPR